MLLAIDTSTRLAGIALYDRDRGLVAEQSWHSANMHTVELLPQVDHLLGLAGASPSALDAVAVALGPGSFTGVRVALAAAKGLALARNLPVVGVSTLEATAYPHRWQPWPVIAVVQAGRGRVCWARYPGAGSAEPDAAPSAPFNLSTVPAMAGQIEGQAVVIGELLPADRALLAERLGDQVHLPPPALGMRRAGSLAELGYRRLAEGAAGDVASLTPIYLQEPVTFPKAS